MAQPDILKVTYKLDAENNTLAIGEKTNGKISVRTNENIGFDLVQCVLQYEIKGKLNVGKTTVDIIDIDRNKTWTHGTLYEYDTYLEIIDEPISFSGTNLQIVWSLIFIVILDDKTRSDLRTKFLKDVSFKNLFKSFNGRIKDKYLLKVKHPNPIYEIGEFQKVVKKSSYEFSIAGAFLLGITALLYTQDIVGTLSYIAVFIGVGATGYGLYKTFSVGLLEKITFTGNRLDENEFELYVQIQKNHQKINHLSIYYTVEEEVVDDRGTSTTTYRETVFTSLRQNLKKPISNKFSVKLAYPKKDIPVAFKRDKVRIYTRIQMEFEFTNHLLYTLKEEFPMIKKN